MYKILVYGMTSSIGGTESVIMNYYRKINGHKIQFDFLFLQNASQSPYEKEILKNGEKIFYLPPKSKHPIRYKKIIKQFFKKYSHYYDCIWANESGLANIDSLKLAKKYGIKRRIIQSHTTSNLYTGITKTIKTFLHNIHKKNISKYATDFWAVSKEAGEWLYPSDVWSEVKVIKNAIDVDKFSYNAAKRKFIRSQYNLEDNYVIGLVGRLSPEKNQVFMLNVFKKLNLPNSKLVIVGSGPDKNKIIKKARELNISNKLVLPGNQNDMQAWYSSFDCYALPSFFEGLSVSGLEAQANGVPILVSSGAKPVELKVNNNFFFLDLNQSLDIWSKKIKYIRETQLRVDKKTIFDNFSKAGLNLNVEYKRVEELFLGE